jgi:ADP-ribose pyrophosphatase YjhB (NUDIX family)
LTSWRRRCYKPFVVVDNPRIRVSAHGLCVVDDRLLLVRVAPPLAEAGAWTLPGGGLDWGEPPQDGVLREVREETGLDAAVDDVAGVFSHAFRRSESRPYDSVHYISILFWLRVVGGTLTSEIGGTSDLPAWVPLSEVSARPLVGLAKYGLRVVESARRMATHGGDA